MPRNMILKTVSPFVGLLLFAFTAHADTVPSAQINRMFVALDLTDEQKVIVKPIVLEGVNERMSILEAAGVEPGTKPKLHQMIKLRGPITASQQKTESQLSKVLSSTQMVKYREFVDGMRNEFRAQAQ